MFHTDFVHVIKLLETCVRKEREGEREGERERERERERRGGGGVESAYLFASRCCKEERWRKLTGQSLLVGRHYYGK